jgi:hypothetical protein
LERRQSPATHTCIYIYIYIPKLRFVWLVWWWLKRTAEGKPGQQIDGTPMLRKAITIKDTPHQAYRRRKLQNHQATKEGNPLRQFTEHLPCVLCKNDIFHISWHFSILTFDRCPHFRPRLVCGMTITLEKWIVIFRNKRWWNKNVIFNL